MAFLYCDRCGRFEFHTVLNSSYLNPKSACVACQTVRPTYLAKEVKFIDQTVPVHECYSM